MSNNEGGALLKGLSLGSGESPGAKMAGGGFLKRLTLGGLRQDGVQGSTKDDSASKKSLKDESSPKKPPRNNRLSVAQPASISKNLSKIFQKRTTIVIPPLS